MSVWVQVTSIINWWASTSVKLVYSRDAVGGLDGFTGTDSVLRRSTTGLVVRYNRAPILWRSKLQKTVALSTAEAEYYSSSEMAVEVIYLGNLLGNMRLGLTTRLCTKTTPRASNGQTTSWGDVSERSTSISASTSLTRPCRMVKCVCTRYRRSTSSRIC
jgi:hypothetical protein